MSKVKLPTELTSLLKKRNEIKDELEQLEAAIILFEGSWLRKNGYIISSPYKEKIFRN